MLSEEQFTDIQFMAGKEQFQMDEFAIGFPFAKSVAVGYAVQDNNDLFWSGYVDAYNQRIAPVIENA